MADSKRLTALDAAILIEMIPGENFSVRPMQDEAFAAARKQVIGAQAAYRIAYSNLAKAETVMMEQAKRFYTDTQINEAQWTP